MRDLSRISGMSLAGLYHYFDSKEELLYLIQKHAFQTIIERVRERLAETSDPEERVRLFIENHLDYFLANKEAMKVLTHEDETLKNGRGRRSGPSSASITAFVSNCSKICDAPGNYNFLGGWPYSASSGWSTGFIPGTIRAWMRAQRSWRSRWEIFLWAACLAASREGRVQGRNLKAVRLFEIGNQKEL